MRNSPSFVWTNNKLIALRDWKTYRKLEFPFPNFWGWVKIKHWKSCGEERRWIVRFSPRSREANLDSVLGFLSHSSTGTWTTVWTDGLTQLDRYKGRCYDLEPVPGEANQYIAYVAYPIDLFDYEPIAPIF